MPVWHYQNHITENMFSPPCSKKLHLIQVASFRETIFSQCILLFPCGILLLHSSYIRNWDGDLIQLPHVLVKGKVHPSSPLHSWGFPLKHTNIHTHCSINKGRCLTSFGNVCKFLLVCWSGNRHSYDIWVLNPRKAGKVFSAWVQCRQLQSKYAKIIPLFWQVADFFAIKTFWWPLPCCNKWVLQVL